MPRPTHLRLCDISWVKMHVYLGYLYLLVRGVLLDLASVAMAVISGSSGNTMTEGDDYEGRFSPAACRCLVHSSSSLQPMAA